MPSCIAGACLYTPGDCGSLRCDLDLGCTSDASLRLTADTTRVAAGAFTRFTVEFDPPEAQIPGTVVTVRTDAGLLFATDWSVEARLEVLEDGSIDGFQLQLPLWLAPNTEIHLTGSIRLIGDTTVRVAEATMEGLGVGGETLQVASPLTLEDGVGSAPSRPVFVGRAPFVAHSADRVYVVVGNPSERFEALPVREQIDFLATGMFADSGPLSIPSTEFAAELYACTPDGLWALAGGAFVAERTAPCSGVAFDSGALLGDAALYIIESDDALIRVSPDNEMMTIATLESGSRYQPYVPHAGTYAGELVVLASSDSGRVIANDLLDSWTSRIRSILSLRLRSPSEMRSSSRSPTRCTHITTLTS